MTTRSAWRASARSRSPTVFLTEGMSAAPRTAVRRPSLYEDITNRIIAELEAGSLPWVQPWGSAAVRAPLGIPKNAATGRNYSGINVLILWGAVVQHGYAAQSWLTFRQAVGLGGNVRKGVARPSSMPTALSRTTNAAARTTEARGPAPYHSSSVSLFSTSRSARAYLRTWSPARLRSRPISSCRRSRS